MNKKLFLLILSIISIVYLFSCKTTEQHFNAGYKKSPVKMAKLTRDKFPCITTGADTVNTTDTVYDLIEAQCPDVDYVTPEGKTIYLPGKTTTVQGRVIYQDRLVTVKVKDSAEVYLLLNNLEVKTAMYEADTATLHKEIRLKDKKITTKNKLIRYLIVPYILLIVAFLLRLMVKRFKPF